MTTVMTLADGQYQLDDGPTFGWFTAYPVTAPTVDSPERGRQDAANPRADGRRFGRDYVPGYTLTFDLAVSGTRETVHALHEELASWWSDPAVRLTPGAVSVLRYNIGDRPRRVYGRPRKFTPNFELSYQGVIKVTATFDTVEPLFYSDEQHAETVTLVPPIAGGVTSPVVDPVTTVDTGVGTGTLHIGGRSATPPVIVIHGPITDPVVEAADNWRLHLRGVSIASDETVTVDPRPWQATVLSSFGDNHAGAFRPGDPSLTRLRLRPGATEFTLRGNDPTGTAWMTVLWHDAYPTF